MRRAALVAAVAVASLARAGVARADDKTEIESLLNEHVVSTASTSAERASVAPALSTTLTSDDLRALGIRSLAEAIDFLSLGVITSDPLRAPDIGSRGVLFPNDDGKHFLLLVNGHAINDPLYGAARFDQGAGVPIDLIDRVEVVVGPGSVLYGSNAMMGVINVITKTTADYKGGHAFGDFEPGRSYRAGAGAGVKLDMLGAPSEITAGVEYYGRYGPTLTFPEVELKTTGNGPFSRIQWGAGLPTNTWGGTVKSAYFTEAPSALVRLKSGDFEVNVFGNMYRRGIPYSTSETGVQFDDADSYELDRALRLDVKHQATLSTLAQLSSRVYADTFDYQRRLDQDGATGCLNAAIAVCEYYDAGAAQWAGVEERLALNWFRDETFVTTLGTDARIMHVQTKEDMIDVASGQALAPTAGRIDQVGGIVSPYAQQTYSPTPWLDMNAGARLDVDSRYSPVLSPRGAVAVRTSDKTTFKVIYSQAFRAPTYAETSIVDYKVAPSPDLQPETVRSVEASVEQRFGTQRVLFGVFRSWWDGLIESEPVSLMALTQLQTEHLEPPIVGNLAQFANVAAVDNYGWNGGWEGSLSERRLRYGLNATGAFTRLQQNGQSVYPIVSPQVFGNAHAVYAIGEGWPTVALAVYGMGPRAADRPSPAGATLPAAPALADVRLALTGRVPSLRAVGYVVTADYTTADHGPYMAGPDFRTFYSVLTADGAQVPSPSYAPIDQFRVMVGLRFDFMTGAQGGSAGGMP
jgi:outer membrane receptor protein involved in Fe transport